MAKLYLGCDLTITSEELKSGIEDLKERLRDDWEVVESLVSTTGTPADAYQKDILENVAQCDAFLGVCDQESIRVGWLLCTATILEKPTLAVAHAASKVTKLVIGAPAFKPTMLFREYNDLAADVPRIVAEEFAPILNQE